MSHRRLGLLLLLLGLPALAACGGGSTAADPCEALVSECLAKQNACVADASGVAQCAPCPAGEYAAATGTCAPIPGEPLVHDFAEFTVTPGQEVLGLCQSWTLNNPEELWINAVELVQDQASHHSNWMFVPDDQYPGGDGVWPCEDRNYHQLDAALLGGVLYAQSTQAAKEVQKFPDGAAVRIPPYSRIIGDVHLLNTGDAPVSGHAKLSVFALPLAEVSVKLVPFHLNYEGLHIPPLASSRFTGECSVGEEFAGNILDMQVYFVLPHTHAMARRFFFDVMGGPRDGESIVAVDGFSSEAHGQAFDPPIDMKGATGYRFGCDYDNLRPDYVDYGFGDQEMCELLGFADSPLGFESTIDSAVAAGMDGDVELFTGPCSTFAFPWAHDKPGGPGPQ